MKFLLLLSTFLGLQEPSTIPYRINNWFYPRFDLDQEAKTKLENFTNIDAEFAKNYFKQQRQPEYYTLQDYKNVGLGIGTFLTLSILHPRIHHNPCYLAGVGLSLAVISCRRMHLNMLQKKLQKYLDETSIDQVKNAYNKIAQPLDAILEKYK
jgi:hypothetical protein